MIEIKFSTKIQGVNQRSIRSRNSTIITSAKYRKAKEELLLEVISETPIRNIGRCEIKIIFSEKQWRGDLDNGSKMILDALQHANIIQDDKYVYPLILDRHNEDYSVIQIKILAEVIA